MAHILVAEDDELTRYLLQLTLEEQGHTVESAANGREAIALVIARQPDLIVLDLMMPGLNGMDVIRAVRDVPDYTDITIIVVTGTASPDEYDETARADLILRKPIPIEELLDSIHSFL